MKTLTTNPVDIELVRNASIFRCFPVSFLRVLYGVFVRFFSFFSMDFVGFWAVSFFDDDGDDWLVFLVCWMLVVSVFGVVVVVVVVVVIEEAILPD